MTDVLLASSLPASLHDAVSRGPDTRELCPRCNGGTSCEQSLDVRHKGGGVVTLKCYRASCDWYAVVVSHSDAKIVSTRIKPPKIYREPTTTIGPIKASELRAAYGVLPGPFRAHGWRIGPRGELVMPVRGPFKTLRGHVTRTFSTPKRCYTYKATCRPWLDWWLYDGPDATTVLVEDCLSACRLSGLNYNAIALLGTNLNVEQLKEITEHCGKRLILALDRDAFEKAIKLAKRHAHLAELLPVCLTEDIKNMKLDSDIRDVLDVGA